MMVVEEVSLGLLGRPPVHAGVVWLAWWAWCLAREDGAARRGGALQQSLVGVYAAAGRWQHGVSWGEACWAYSAFQPLECASCSL